MLLLAVSALGQETVTSRFEKVVGRMVEAINRADYEAIEADFSEAMLTAFPLEQSRPFFQNLSSSYGKIQWLAPPRYVPPSQAVVVAHCERGVLDIKVVLNERNKIIGLWFLPHADDIPVPQRHKTKLSLPYRGRWLVLWGGDTAELNQHHDVPNQRFAFDFVGIDEHGSRHRGNGRANQDYYAFGRKILAPADGMVTDVINGVRDNTPVSMNPYLALGNAVFIQHATHEVSVLAHLKYGSIRVSVGQHVKRGQVIGLCGNSGNSSEPHLHYHLQNTPIIQDATGIKCYFDEVTVATDTETKLQRDYSPVRDDVILAE
jgi:hypothetical protein